MSKQKSQSWGRYFNYSHQPAALTSRNDKLPDLSGPILPYGMGRSYGDSCLNDGGNLVSSKGLKHFIDFDQEKGLIRCEAGVTLAELHEVTVPNGWFVKVTPGTKFVTVGGAIANDVHGKNHWRAGTFGCHVTQLELLRSDGQRLLCSPQQNQPLFQATIGGLGLTGMIVWAEFQLKPIKNPFINDESFQCPSLDRCIELFAESREDYEYRVAWIDCLATGEQLGRSIFTRGNHNQTAPNNTKISRQKLAVPITFPHGVLNSFTVKSFNALYYRKLMQPQVSRKVHYDPFHYPLDSIHQWNRIYGPKGFMQYQCVVTDEPVAALKELLKLIAASGQASFLSVLKEHGPVESPGMLSFPRRGYTLALDFPNKGEKTLALLSQLDRVVKEANGAIYPAKDARMPGDMFKFSYPRWQEFQTHIDPKFESSFWRRVMAEE